MMRVVSFVLILLLSVSSGFSENQEGGMTSKLYEQLGTDIVLHCETPLPVVEWSHNGGRLHTNDKELSLVNVKKHQAGTYCCRNPKNKEVLSVTDLHLGVPPERLDIECWASAYPEMINCTWDLRTDTNLDTTFIATYRLGLKGVEPPGQCVQIAHNPNSCLIMDYEMFSEHPYLVNVTVVNQLGSVTKLHHFFVEDIIRPDPPVNVSLSPVHGDSRKLLLQWSPPPSWPHLDYFPLSYLIRYKRNKAQAYRTVGPYEQTSFLLSGLRGGSMVHVQVAAQDFTGLGHHSDWSPVVSAHPWRKA